MTDYDIEEVTLRNGTKSFVVKEVYGTSRYTVNHYKTLEEAEKWVETMAGYDEVSRQVVKKYRQLEAASSSPTETSPLRQGSWLRRLIGLTH